MTLISSTSIEKIHIYLQIYPNAEYGLTEMSKQYKHTCTQWINHTHVELAICVLQDSKYIC